MEGEFVSFLPGDNQDLASAATASVIELINNDLSQLLRLPPQQFWQVVLADKSLHTCLDSFLRFRRRCYDDSPESIQGSSDLLLQLSQRVFRVYWRMAHPQEPASSSSSSSATSKTAAAAAPSPQQAADLLYNKWLVDVPKMLDLAVLYGPGNSILTGQLLQQLLLLQPKYAQDILTLAEPLSGNLHELADNVRKLANKVLSSGPAAAEGLVAELAEAVRYFTDACLTLQAFVTCLPAAAALLLHPSNHGSLLLGLAVIFSSVLPLLQRVAQQPAAASAADEASVQGLKSGRVLQLQQCLVSLVYHLLTAAFCTADGAAAAGGPEAIAATAAATNGSSSGLKGSQRQQQQQQCYDPEVQGQELMNTLMLLAHPSEHMYQQQQQHDKGGLLAAVNHAHHLDVAVAAAMEQGLLALDDAQFDYMLALVDGDRQLLQQRQQHLSAAAAAITSGSSSSQAPAAGGSSSSTLPPAAELSAKIQSIKELLPDYGDGFLTAVLYHNSFDTEQTINCLLEGTLPKPLQDLDPLLNTWIPPSSSSSATQQASSSSRSSSTSAGLSWTGLAQEAAAAAAAGPAAAAIPLPSLAQAAAAAPKPSVDRRTGRILGALPSQVRNVTKNIAYELQYEYDDEYDDSFDDLVGPGNDGVCDIEGEETAAEAAARKAATPGVQLRAAAAAADEYADEPGSSGSSAPRRPQQQQQQQQQQRGKQKDKLWVLDGKIYNYKKDGATEVAGMAGAEKALKAAKQAALEIHGLGPGGNIPLPVEDDNAQQQRRGSSSSSNRGRGGGAAAAAVGAGRGGATAGSSSSTTGGRGAPGAGRGRGGGSQQQQQHGAGDGVGSSSSSSGRGRGSFAHKEQHKAAVANHHRKDRATAKQAKGMF